MQDDILWTYRVTTGLSCRMYQGHIRHELMQAARADMDGYGPVMFSVMNCGWRQRISVYTLVQEGTNFPPRVRIYLYPHQESIMWVQLVLSFA